MDFITIDGKLSIEGVTISQQRLTNTVRMNNIIYVYFFVWAIDTFTNRLNRAEENGGGTWVSVVFFGFILLLYVLSFADFLFRRYWRKKIDISQISRIRMAPTDEGLETHVVVTMTSKRYKTFKFRTLEKQYDSFIETIRAINPGVQVVVS